MSENVVRIHPNYVRSESLGQEITELCGYINAATYQLLVKIREFDQDKLWALDGICSCAHWLNWKCGMSLNTARQKVFVAHALEDLPMISEAFSKGEISYSKVRAMTRVATPENEPSLMNIALHGTAAHVERVCSGYRRARKLHGIDAANEQHQDRELRYHWDDDGSLVLKGRLPGEIGAMVLKALTLAMDRAETEVDVSAETSDEEESPDADWHRERVPFSTKRADALAELAESYLANGPKDSSSADRYQVMLHVSAETSEIEHGPNVSAETSKRICCDTSVSVLKEDEKGEPLSIGRKSRVVPPVMARALKARDRICRFPGCTHQHFIDAHHIEHWSEGGETSMDNLIRLCRHHHRLVHEGGFVCERSHDGQVLFRDERGELIGPAGHVPKIEITPAARRRIRDQLEEFHIDAETCVPDTSGGMHMDLAMAVEAVWDRDFPDGVW